jgi:ribonuclease I
MIQCRFAYFGYSAEFAAPAVWSIAERRREANRLVIAAYGAAPALAYVEPGLPFPEYVLCLTWDPVDQVYD